MNAGKHQAYPFCEYEQLYLDHITFSRKGVN